LHQNLLYAQNLSPAHALASNLAPLEKQTHCLSLFAAIELSFGQLPFFWYSKFIRKEAIEMV
jgi:hypothetical protein